MKKQYMIEAIVMISLLCSCSNEVSSVVDEREVIMDDSIMEITDREAVSKIKMKTPCQDYTYQKECTIDDEYYLIKSDVIDIMLVDCEIDEDKVIATLYYQCKIEDIMGFPLHNIEPTFVYLYLGDKCISDSLVDFVTLEKNCESLWRLTWDITEHGEEEIKNEDLYVHFDLTGTYGTDIYTTPVPEPVISEEKLKLYTWEDE